MAVIGIYMQIVVILLLTRNVYSQSVVEALFTTLSQRLDRLDRTFETRLENAVNTINGRLDRIEKIVGVNEDISENDDEVVLKGIQNGQTLWTDIQESKYKFMEAFAKEKQLMREFTIEYGEQFEKLKSNITDILQEMNSTISETRKSMAATMSEFQNEVSDTLNLTETNMNEFYNDVIGKIEMTNDFATSEREIISAKLKNATDRISAAEDKQDKQDSDLSSVRSSISSVSSRVSSLSNKQDSDLSSVRSSISSVSSRVSSLSSKQNSNYNSLSSSISSVRSSLSSEDSSLSSRISSIYSRVSTLEERKPGFSAELTSNMYLSKGRIVPFDNAYNNIGSHFSTYSGKFTAPEPGTYILSAAVESVDNEWAGVSIMKNGETRGSIYSGRNAFSTSSFIVVQYLSSGDKAWVETWTDSKVRKSRTKFSAVLIG